MTAPADPIADGEALKPCPFCGGEGRTRRLAMLWFGQCADCDATTARLIYESQAIAAWNRRAPAPSPWRRIPETVTPGEAPWDEGRILVCDNDGGPVYMARWSMRYRQFENAGMVWEDRPRYWMPLPPPPDAPERPDGPRPDAKDDQP